MLIKHNLIGRKMYLLLVSGSCIPSSHNCEYNYCICITVRVGLGLW